MYNSHRAGSLNRANQTLARDVELQHLDKKKAGLIHADSHKASLLCLFGLSESQLRSVPGTMSYYRYIEACFQPLLADEYASVWSALGVQKPLSSTHCWTLFDKVCSTLRNLKDESSSIEDVWLHSCPQPGGNRMARRSPQTGDACYIAVFSVLCWATMTFRPQLDWDKFKDSPSLMLHQEPFDQKGLKMDYVRRPIPAIFRQFHRTMSTTRWRYPIREGTTDHSVSLEIASLNYASLNMIGKIELVWVDDLTSHLEFDVTKRRLSIFRFPSFCAMSAMAEEIDQAVPIFKGILRTLYSNNPDAPKESHSSAQIHQEVLMSYRLLFGQKRRSRQLAQAALKKLKTASEDDYDSLLDLVCTQPYGSRIHNLPLSLWPVTCRGVKESPLEESAYSSQDDFPLFGQRLAKLQEFTYRQQPSRLRDLWRDRRNPLQWYTFWAVLVVGGLSILLGLLQLLVSVAQLIVVLAIPQNCTC
ncbi:hypothetical protein CC78DRAFT_475942 [Lojkania enalia]|uniref:Uncharacterized protein n=1 Tax=Lojkania enalia TaxID=147567 RepID=A0A9P4MZ83_9PLEO|nr:hypothetical protein CC78DRAFT_475942 [Didymosphaeria enalia]